LLRTDAVISAYMSIYLVLTEEAFGGSNCKIFTNLHAAMKQKKQLEDRDNVHVTVTCVNPLTGEHREIDDFGTPEEHSSIPTGFELNWEGCCLGCRSNILTGNERKLSGVSKVCDSCDLYICGKIEDEADQVSYNVPKHRRSHSDWYQLLRTRFTS